MAAQVFADEELERLQGFPEIGRDELFRLFTLSPAQLGPTGYRPLRVRDTLF